MISFPAPIAPWGRLLHVFPPELGIALGRVVQRIAAVIAPIHSSNLDLDDEPDGFNGLVNRGGYEHLVASDWLLADEAPEEFERRAAMHEHLFLNPARRTPAHGLGCIALFDAGPEQLGAPRIVHLALAITLMRRAEQARARLSWAILQDAEKRIFTGLSEAEITTLLLARTNEAASDARLKEWIDRARADHEPREIWLIGGPSVQVRCPDSAISRILVEDVFKPGTRQTQFEIRHGNTAARRIVLELPEDATCARLLRDPFAIRTAETKEFRGSLASSGIVCAKGGRRLFASAGQGRLISVPIPNTPQPEPGRIKQHFFLRDLGTAVAANVLGRTTYIVSFDQVSLHVHHRGAPWPPPAGTYFLEDEIFEWPKDTGSSALFPCVRGTGADLLVLDAAGNLFRLAEASHRLIAKRIERNVLALASCHGTASYIAVNWETSQTELVAVARRPRFSRIPVLDRPGHGGAFFGFGAYLVAIEITAQIWRIARVPRAPLDIFIAASERVVGVIQDTNYAEALVTLRGDGHALALKGVNWDRILLTSSDPLTHVTVFDQTPLIAYTTAAGDLAVYSLLLNRDLCRFKRSPDV